MDGWQEAKMYARYGGTLMGHHHCIASSIRLAIAALKRGDIEMAAQCVFEISERVTAAEAVTPEQFSEPRAA